MSESRTSTETHPTESDPAGTDPAGTDPRTTTPEPEDPPEPAPQGDGTPGPAPGAADDEAPAPAPAPGTGIYAVPPAGGKPPSRVRATWAGDQRFDVGREGGPSARLDGRAQTGPSPVDALVGALASCVAIDVVEILAKRRTPVRSLTVDATGERANAVPARVTRARLRFHVAGAGIERAHAERAIELAVTKYCSVRDSLDPTTPVEWELVLEA